MFDAGQWVNADAIYVPMSAPSAYQAIFLNTHTKVGAMRDTWTRVNLGNELPYNAVAVHLTGLLIITHGTLNEIADLTVSFRKDESIGETGASHQAIESNTQGGQRSTMSCWVPLSDDKSFQYKWHVPQLGEWPEYSAYGINLKVDAIAVKN